MQVGNRKGVDRHENGWLKVVVLGIAWLIILSLAKDVWQIRVGFDRISESEERLKIEKFKNLALKQKAELVETGEYKEKLIREKLNMQKTGEVLVVMPKGGVIGTKGGQIEATPEQNWEKWWKLLRG